MTVELSSALRFPWVTPPTIQAQQNNYDPGPDNCFRLSANGIQTITGIAGGIDGRLWVGANVGSSDILFAHQDAASNAENRIITGTLGTPATLTPNGAIILQCDGTTQRWRALNLL